MASEPVFAPPSLEDVTDKVPTRDQLVRLKEAHGRGHNNRMCAHIAEMAQATAWRYLHRGVPRYRLRPLDKHPVPDVWPPTLVAPKGKRLPPARKPPVDVVPDDVGAPSEPAPTPEAPRVQPTAPEPPAGPPERARPKAGEPLDETHYLDLETYSVGFLQLRMQHAREILKRPEPERPRGPLGPSDLRTWAKEHERWWDMRKWALDAVSRADVVVFREIRREVLGGRKNEATLRELTNESIDREIARLEAMLTRER